MTKKWNTWNLPEGVGCTYQRGKSIEVGHIFYRVPQFKYLGGVLLTQDNDLKSEIERKI